MDFRFNPLPKFPHGYCGFGFLVSQEGRCRPVIGETSGEGALLVGRLLCSRLHNAAVMWRL